MCRCVFTVKMPARLVAIVSNLPITLLLSFCCLIVKVNNLLSEVEAFMGSLVKAKPIVGDILCATKKIFELVVCIITSVSVTSYLKNN